jgi:glycosyltransferase domain-containing protein
MYGKDFTIIVPTYRRSHFLARMIGGLDQLDFGGQLFLSDSSERREFGITNDLIQNLAPSYHVEHISVPKSPGMPLALSLNQAIAVAATMVETKYVTMTCDDDIPIPITLEKASIVMDKDKDVGGVLGDHVFFWLNDQLNKKDYVNGVVPDTGMLHPTFENLEATATNRLFHFIRYFCNTMYLMTRADQYIECVPPDAYKINFPHFSAEYLWMFTPVLKGKIRLINGLQVVRQRHDSNLRDRILDDTDRSITEAILRPHWQYDANLFVNHIARFISNVDGLAFNDALAVAKQGFARIVGGRLLGTLGDDGAKLPHIRERIRLYKTVGTEEQAFLSECVDKILKYDVTEKVKY